MAKDLSSFEWLIAGMIIGGLFIAMYLIQANECNRRTIKNREPMVQGYYYTTTDGIGATSPSFYEIGDMVCLH